MNQIRIVSSRKSLHDIIVVLFLSFVAAMPFWAFGAHGKDEICILSFVFNSIVFIAGMTSSYKKYSISMELVYWVFMYFFMYFAPLIQYLTSVYPWRGSLTDNDVLITNLVIFLFNIVFIISMMTARRVKIKSITNANVTKFLCSNFEFGKKFKILVTVVAVLMAVFSFSRTGLAGIAVSRVQATQVFYLGSNSAIKMIVESVIPAFLAYIVAEAAQSTIAKKENPIRFIILFAALLICFFPTSLPRYKTVTIYGTVFLVLFPKLRKGAKFFWLFIIAMFFMFPLMNSFRHILSMESFRSVFENGFMSVYVEADYDAYRMLSSAIKYVSRFGIKWGFQLLGVFLFFVPSAVWGGKPGGSGAMLIRSEFGNDVASNVSCPFIGEGYLNFGIPGVIFFAVFLGVAICKMDMGYWRTNKDKEYIAFSPYLFMMFMILFMLRGDLLSSFAYICGFVATGYMINVAAKYIS
ncbi:MAG: O-antigen polysaccharide polymerase Wzy [Clostridia bacterium]|nr:O-antigen polysaccharide polymerase Wzy [Clostridia bacterium]